MRRSWSPDPALRGYFKFTSHCLSALLAAERYDDLLALLACAPHQLWFNRQYGVRALAAMGKHAEAIAYAERSGGSSHDSPEAVARVCEEVLLSCGRVEDAYRRYAIAASWGGTYLATFRAVAKKYPHKGAEEILADLVAATPGDEGKWFAAAKQAGLYDEALALASRAPCDPKTLTRAARDYADKEPAFALGAGWAALYWLLQGYGYDVSSDDVWEAYRAILAAAERCGGVADAKQRVREMVAAEPPGERFVNKVLGRELAL